MMDSVMPYGGGVLGQLAIVDKAGEVLKSFYEATPLMIIMSAYLLSHAFLQFPIRCFHSGPHCLEDATPIWKSRGVISVQYLP
jgi:hypothetical protein